jgi:integrase/recombinase XerD
VDLESGKLERDLFSETSNQKTKFSEQDILNIINALKIANRDEHYIDDIRRKLYKFAEFTNWEFDFNDVTRFFESVKHNSASNYRKYVLHVRTLLKNLEVPYWNKIVLPKVPKRQKIVIKKDVVKRVILNLWNLWDVNRVTRFRVVSAFILGATSGLRSEEIYELTLDDIDLDNRTVYVRFGNSAATSKTIKDYEERVVFFNHEAQAILSYYFEIYDGRKELFSQRSIEYVYERHPEAFRINGLDIRLKHMRKFFIQEWERRGGSIAIKRMLAGGGDEDTTLDPKQKLTGHSGVEIELESYNFQDSGDLRKIYDAVGIRVFD